MQRNGMEKGEHTRQKLKFTVRPCRGVAEYRQCAALQKRIWGPMPRANYPARLFVVVDGMGGQVLGAFVPRHGLIGFLVSMPAWHGTERYFHSLMMGVLPRFQNQGVAKALKWKQREQALRLGIDRIQWTFDPLRTKNAYLNIERLGVVVRRYQPDYYGNLDGPWQRGLPSDRLICEWWLKSSRVYRAQKGARPRSQAGDAAAGVALPANAWMLARNDLAKATEAQLKVRRQLLAYFRKGYMITGFSVARAKCEYLLDRSDLTR
ncbi:MAG: GNAT family N-acetyltransferase [Terriglobia bacterium]